MKNTNKIESNNIFNLIKGLVKEVAINILSDKILQLFKNNKDFFISLYYIFSKNDFLYLTIIPLIIYILEKIFKKGNHNKKVEKDKEDINIVINVNQVTNINLFIKNESNTNID